MTSSILLTRPRKTLASECWLWHFWQIWTHRFMLVLRFFAKKHSFGAMPWKKWPKKWFLGPKSTFLAINPQLTPPTHWLGQKRHAMAIQSARNYGRSKQGLWCTQLLWRTHYKWRTRFEWRTHRVDRKSLHYQPTPLVPRPRFGQGPTQVPIIGREGTLVWTLPKRTSPQPTRGDVELKVNFRQFVWYVPLWPVDTNEQYRVVASLNGLKFNPLTFFSAGPCFTDI